VSIFKLTQSVYVNFPRLAGGCDSLSALSMCPYGSASHRLPPVPFPPLGPEFYNSKPLPSVFPHFGAITLQGEGSDSGFPYLTVHTCLRGALSSSVPPSRPDGLPLFPPGVACPFLDCRFFLAFRSASLCFFPFPVLFLVSRVPMSVLRKSSPLGNLPLPAFVLRYSPRFF